MAGLLGRMLQKGVAGAAGGAGQALKAEHDNKLAMDLAERRAQLNKDRDALIGGGAQQRYFEFLTQGMTPEEQEQARRVQAGVAPRAGTITGVERTATTPGLTDAVAGSQQKIEERKSYGKEVGTTAGLEDSDRASVEGDIVFAKKTAENQAKIEFEAPKARTKLKTVLSKTDRLLGKDGEDKDGLINKIIGQVESAPPAVFRGMASAVPGTDAYDMAQNILTLKANIGFDTLQEMRDNSPTGGALGQVAVQELENLQANISSLDIKQSKDQLIENLGLVKDNYRNYRQNAVGAFEEVYGQPFSKDVSSGQLTPSEGFNSIDEEFEAIRKRRGL